MEDKKLLTNEELEKVSGGRAKLDKNVRNAFELAESELERIIDDRAYDNEVYLMLHYCRQALDGRISAEDALNFMQTHCNQINIDYRWNLQNILDKLKSSLGR